MSLVLYGFSEEQVLELNQHLLGVPYTHYVNNYGVSVLTFDVKEVTEADVVQMDIHEKTTFFNQERGSIYASLADVFEEAINIELFKNFHQENYEKIKKDLLSLYNSNSAILNFLKGSGWKAFA